MYSQKGLKFLIVLLVVFAFAISLWPQEGAFLNVSNMEATLVPTEPKLPPKDEVSKNHIKQNQSEKKQKPSVIPKKKIILKAKKDETTYRFQLGSYAEEKYAFELVKKLRIEGFDPKYEKVKKNYRVVITNVPESKKELVQSILKDIGLTDFIIRQEKGFGQKDRS